MSCNTAVGPQGPLNPYIFWELMTSAIQIQTQRQRQRRRWNNWNTTVVVYFRNPDDSSTSSVMAVTKCDICDKRENMTNVTPWDPVDLPLDSLRPCRSTPGPPGTLYQSPHPAKNLSLFSLYSRLLADFLSHLGREFKLIEFEAEYEYFCTCKVEKPQNTTSSPSLQNVHL